MSFVHAALTFAMSTMFFSCALQAGAALNRDHSRGPLPVYFAFEGRIHNVRGAGSVFGWRTQLARESAQRPVEFRSVGVVAGYRVPRLGIDRFSFEPGMELLLGRPAGIGAAAFGPGFYSGAHALALLRLFGEDDARDVFALAITNLDLFAAVRCGVWSAQERSSDETEHAEWALELGLRFTLTSDLVSKEAQEERR